MNVFVVGKSVGTDWQLIAQISKSHVITITHDPGQVQGHPLLKYARLLLLDCRQNVDLCLELVKQLNPRTSELAIVLVDGGLKQEQLAEAFACGIVDYFAAPYDTSLLVERINVLCSRTDKHRDEVVRRAGAMRQSERNNAMN